jgi:hypothetical protein
MFDPRGASLASALAVLVAAQATAEPPAPPAPLELGAKLCPYPLGLPFDENEAEKRRPELQRRLLDALVNAGFSVADPGEVEALEERVRTDLGGFIDPATGQRDEARHEAYRERLAASLAAQLGCEAQLHAVVATVRAGFVGGTARWDGATRTVSSTGRQVMNAIAGVHESGWVVAFSLWLQLTDLRGEDIAFRSAGIETPVQFAVLEDQDYVGEDRWLTDAANLDEAIASALGPAAEYLRLRGRP